MAYSRQFLAVPDTSFNILQASLVSPYGRKFLREVQAHHRQIYSWTVIDEKNMDWCIRREMDGVLVEDVPKFLEMCEPYKEETKYRWPLKLDATARALITGSRRTKTSRVKKIPLAAMPLSELIVDISLTVTLPNSCSVKGRGRGLSSREQKLVSLKCPTAIRGFEQMVG